VASLYLELPLISKRDFNLGDSAPSADKGSASLCLILREFYRAASELQGFSYTSELLDCCYFLRTRGSSFSIVCCSFGTGLIMGLLNKFLLANILASVFYKLSSISHYLDSSVGFTVNDVNLGAAKG
jgi:hypothetical protein